MLEIYEKKIVCNICSLEKDEGEHAEEDVDELDVRPRCGRGWNKCVDMDGKV